MTQLMTSLFLVVLGIELSVLIILVFFSFFSKDAPYIPTQSHALSEIADALNVGPSSILYELGCGDARILRAALSNSPSAIGIGIERSTTVYWLARLRTRRDPSIRIKRGNLFNTDLQDATHIYLYLLPQTLAKLESKLDRELTQGTRVVSCDFQFPNKTPLEIIPLRQTTLLSRTLYVYEW